MTCIWKLLVHDLRHRELQHLHVVLEDGSPHHGEGSNEETSSDLLDGGEADVLAAEEWVDDSVHDGHNDDDGNGIQVGENIVGHATELHGRAHVGQVGVHLTVRQPEDGDPEEHGAGGETTADLINPRVVEIVPLGRAGTESGGLDGLPHLTVVPAAPCLERVDAEATAKSLEQKLESRSDDVSAWWCENVEFLAVDENGQGDEEHDSWDQVGEPETNVTFSVDHGNLTNKGTNVDEEVEIVVDTGHGDSRIDNNTLALDNLDAHLLLGNLLGNKGRNVGLESTGSEAHDQDSENKDTEGGVGLVEDLGSRGGNEDEMTNFSNNDRVEDSLEATEVGVGNPGSEEGADIDPESVEGGE